jgi:hypothetical protein
MIMDHRAGDRPAAPARPGAGARPGPRPGRGCPPASAASPRTSSPDTAANLDPDPACTSTRPGEGGFRRTLLVVEVSNRPRKCLLPSPWQVTAGASAGQRGA